MDLAKRGKPNNLQMVLNELSQSLKAWNEFKQSLPVDLLIKEPLDRIIYDIETIGSQGDIIKNNDPKSKIALDAMDRFQPATFDLEFQLPNLIK